LLLPLASALLPPLPLRFKTAATEKMRKTAGKRRLLPVLPLLPPFSSKPLSERNRCQEK